MLVSSSTTRIIFSASCSTARDCCFSRDINLLPSSSVYWFSFFPYTRSRLIAANRFNHLYQYSSITFRIYKYIQGKVDIITLHLPLIDPYGSFQTCALLKAASVEVDIVLSAVRPIAPLPCVSACQLLTSCLLINKSRLLLRTMMESKLGWLRPILMAELRPKASTDPPPCKSPLEPNS